MRALLCVLLLCSSAIAHEAAIQVQLPYKIGSVLIPMALPDRYDVGDDTFHSSDHFDPTVRPVQLEIQVWVERAGGSPIDWNLEETAYIYIENASEGQMVDYVTHYLDLADGDWVYVIAKIDNGPGYEWYLMNPKPGDLGGFRIPKSPGTRSLMHEVDGGPPVVDIFITNTELQP